MKRLLRKRWFRWTFGIIAALALWFVASEFYGEWKWNRYVEDARKRGVKLYIDEFLPKEPIPDEENFAAMPVWREAYANGRGYAEMPKRSWNVQYTGSRPDRVDLARTLSEIVAAKWVTPHPGEPEPDAILRSLQVMEPFFSQLREAAPRRASWYGVDWKQGLSASVDHINRAPALSRPLLLKGCALINKGDVDGALAVFRDLERLANSFDAEPSLICWHSGLGIRWANRELVAEGLHAGAWSDEALKQIQQALARRNEIAACRFAFESERAVFNETLETMRKKRGAVGALGGIASLRGLYVRVRSLSSSWWRNNMLWINRAFDEEMGALDGIAERWRPAMERKYDPAKFEPMEELELQIAAVAMPAVSAISRGGILAHAMDRLAGLACALEQFKRAHGAYPASLGELVPDWIATLPHDPVTGDSFKYSRSEPEGYLLYSTGADGRDDGGSPGGPNARDSDLADWRWFAPRGERANSE